MNRTNWVEKMIVELLARYSASDVYTEEAPKEDESELLSQAACSLRRLKEFYIKKDLINQHKGTIYSQMKALVKHHKLCSTHLTDLTREDKQYLENRARGGDRLLWVIRKDGTYLTKLEKPAWSNELHQHLADGRWIHLSELIQVLTQEGERAFLVFISKKKRRTHCYGTILEVEACENYRHGWRFVNEQAYPTLNPKEKENENGSSVEQTNEENQKVPPRGNGN